MTRNLNRASARHADWEKSCSLAFSVPVQSIHYVWSLSALTIYLCDDNFSSYICSAEVSLVRVFENYEDKSDFMSCMLSKKPPFCYTVNFAQLEHVLTSLLIPLILAAQTNEACTCLFETTAKCKIGGVHEQIFVALVIFLKPRLLWPQTVRNQYFYFTYPWLQYWYWVVAKKSDSRGLDWGFLLDFSWFILLVEDWAKRSFFFFVWMWMSIFSPHVLLLGRWFILTVIMA